MTSAVGTAPTRSTILPAAPAIAVVRLQVHTGPIAIGGQQGICALTRPSITVLAVGAGMVTCTAIVSIRLSVDTHPAAASFPG